MADQGSALVHRAAILEKAVKNLLDQNGYVEALLRKHLPDDYAEQLVVRLSGRNCSNLAIKWIADASHHEDAALEINEYDDEWSMHIECARILRKCALELGQ